MLGYPGEEESGVRKTIELAMRLKLHFATFVIVTPSPNTPMVRHLASRGVVVDPEAGYDDTDNVFPLAEIIPERLKETRRRAERRFFLRVSQLFRLLFGVRSWTELAWLTEAGVRFLSTAMAGKSSERR